MLVGSHEKKPQLSGKTSAGLALSFQLRATDRLVKQFRQLRITVFFQRQCAAAFKGDSSLFGEFPVIRWTLANAVGHYSFPADMMNSLQEVLTMLLSPAREGLPFVQSGQTDA